MKIRTIRGRIALWISLTVVGSVIVFASVTATAFYMVERAEAEALKDSPEAAEAERRENLNIVVTVGRAMLIAALCTTAAAAGIGLHLSGRALAPMREAATRARAARSGDGELWLPMKGTGNEWDELATVLNQLLNEQRLTAIRHKAFTANVAHELRTPLTVMLGEVEVALRRERTAAEYRESLIGTKAELMRLRSLVNTLLMLARADSGDLGATWIEFDLAEVAREAASRVHRRRAGAPGLVHVEAGATPVRGDPVLTDRVLENLVDNSFRHGGGTVTMQVSARPPWGVVTVLDDGPGIPASVRSRLFERFNKPAGATEGFGLGLAIAHAFTTSQGGRLSMDENSPLTSFVVELPLAESWSATQRQGALR